MTPFNSSQSAKKNPRSIHCSTPRVLLLFPIISFLSLLFCVGQSGGDGVSRHNQCALYMGFGPSVPAILTCRDFGFFPLFLFSSFLFFPFFFFSFSLFHYFEETSFSLFSDWDRDDLLSVAFLFFFFCFETLSSVFLQFSSF